MRKFVLETEREGINLPVGDPVNQDACRVILAASAEHPNSEVPSL